MAYNKCDIFLTSKEYMRYMWWNMKKNVSSRIVEMVKTNEALASVSEQTLYTLAHDIV